jgi:NAD dependent epimerase/dehydratase family enzyme
MGQKAQDLMLSSTRVHPKKLLDHQFEFRYPTIEDALRHLTGNAAK